MNGVEAKTSSTVEASCAPDRKIGFPTGFCGVDLSNSVVTHCTRKHRIYVRESFAETRQASNISGGHERQGCCAPDLVSTSVRTCGGIRSRNRENGRLLAACESVKS